jgi:NADH-quinone oxidoreductase subunit L
MRAQANKAAIKAMVLNRVSDLFFTVGILITFYTFKSVEFSTVFGLAPYVATSVVSILGLTVPPVTLITVLLFLGAMGKSAQVSLHT